MDMLIPIAVIAVIAIALLVVLYRSVSHWHWANITLVFLVFVAGIFAAILVSRSFKTHSAWQQAFQKNEAAFLKNKGDAEVRMRGDPTDLTPGPESVIGINEALNLELFGRGRVWAHGAAELSGENFVVTLNGAPPAPADAAASPATPAEAGGEAVPPESPAEQLRDGMLVFVFRDAAVSELEGATAPALYLGIMTVASTDGARVTLRPTGTLKLEQRQLVLDAQGKAQLDANGAPQFVSQAIFPAITQELTAPSSTWTLYEKMPTDTRDTFKRRAGIDIDPQRENLDVDAYQAAYRAALHQYLTPELFGLDLAQPPQAEIYERMVDRYAFDYMRLDDITQYLVRHKDERVVATFDPPADEKYVRLRLTAKSNEFEIDTTTGNVADTGIFDTQGRAVLAELKLPDGTGKIRLDPETVLIVDPESAAKLRNSEQFVVEGEVFVRKLSDFPALISEFVAERERTFDAILKLIADIEQLKLTDGDLQTQERQRATQLDQLTQDRTNLERDLAAITQLYDRRTTEIADLREAINRAYASIAARYDQIRQQSDAVLNTARQ